MNGLGVIATLHKITPHAVIAMLAVAVFLSISAPARAAEAPANDDVENAEIIRGDSASVGGNNESATREKGESDHIRSGSSPGENSVWYRWTAWKSGSTEADVCRSDFDSVVAVYTRDSRGELERIADNDDECSSPNPRGGSLVFEAKLEETYWIAVSGYSKASSGDFTLRLRPHLPPE
jgi:hypothetical protein